MSDYAYDKPYLVVDLLSANVLSEHPTLAEAESARQERIDKNAHIPSIADDIRVVQLHVSSVIDNRNDR